MSGGAKLTRRQFFGRGAAAALGLSAAGCDATDPFALEKPPVPGAERWRRFEEKSVATACAQCWAGCGIRVRVVEGRAVKIAGDPESPINRGGIGPRGLSGLQALYDPDRIRQPLRRKGPRGSGQWEPISWADALEELGGRLRKLRERGAPERLGILCDRERGLMRDLWERFARSYGTPNFFDGSSRGGVATAQARYLMQGTREIPAYDWTSTRYVLSLGAGLLEASCQAIYFARATAYLKRGRSEKHFGNHQTRSHLGRGKIVQVEPSYSRTASSADEWISIAPGSYGAFALGLAHVLVRDGLYDRDFVEQHCFGFETWTEDGGRTHRGFRDVLLSEHTPERVAGICQVDADTLERIAHELAEQRPAFAITDDRATAAANGLQTAMAVQALNALLGSLERPGGVLSQRAVPLAAWPAAPPDELAEAGLRMPRLDFVGAGRYPLATSVAEELPRALVSGRPYRLDTLLLYYANPCYAWMNPERWTRALEAVPFVATFTPF
ncbi:MAG: molybdopterin-dependent oxidoreductase, partial [Myxococcota bacterium]